MTIWMNHKIRNKKIFHKAKLYYKIDNINNILNWIAITKKNKKEKRERENCFFKPKQKQAIQMESIMCKKSNKKFNLLMLNKKWTKSTFNHSKIGPKNSLYKMLQQKN